MTNERAAPRGPTPTQEETRGGHRRLYRPLEPHRRQGARQLPALSDRTGPAPRSCQARNRPPKANKDDAYVFERRVDIPTTPTAPSRAANIDLYKRGHFVLEAKRVTEHHESSRCGQRPCCAPAAQADTYIRALPAGEGRPPFSADLRCRQKPSRLYAEFTRSGATYRAVSGPQNPSHSSWKTCANRPSSSGLKGIWTNPDQLDPSKYAARVTARAKQNPGRLARALEKRQLGSPAPSPTSSSAVCSAMFCEDVDLLPKGQLHRIADPSSRPRPSTFPRRHPLAVGNHEHRRLTAARSTGQDPALQRQPVPGHQPDSVKSPTRSSF